MFTKADDHLTRYRDRYRTVKREDGISYLLTRYRDRDGMSYDVYDYSDTHLAACLPPQAGRNLLRAHPGTFALHQDAEDAVVLLFPEGRLDDLADMLRLRKRRRLSETQRRLSAERLRRFQFAPARQGEQTAQERTISD